MRCGEEESEEIEEIKATCSKCSNNNKESTYNFSHIQDLCPADRKRISLLIKHLAKCTREMHEVKSDLAVSESEKKALLEEYQIFLNRHNCEKKQLEFELSEAKTKRTSLRIQIIQALELLTCQLLAQEKQFMNLVENVRDLLCEKVIIHEVLSQKEIERSNLVAKIQRLKESLRLEKLLHSRDLAQNLLKNKMIDKASQTTDDLNLYTKCDIRKYNFNATNIELNLKHSQDMKTKSKNDLEELTSDGTLMRDLFFRVPNIEDNESLYLMPTLSKEFNQIKSSTSFVFN
ncbi:hypothetical protein HZH68_002067 [Vespula germanica]|uniref:Uncharacterized protein n=3 Tax=Vespula TaxID=7451 RepID=A0A834KV79_VESGE|nr:uncharacterized protein LOC122637852 isoform X2 [Vespula pensylvanica]XP_043686257.1 uncharacterized protein LOC122637852 isoform X2 [Vespula pensylvanica]KAF7413578.1 hypothetical protein HZH68_002067 [Vespula germanica]KAF7434106.1 hypothetical protein H0235_002297 [Vespula pensylvanica]